MTQEYENISYDYKSLLFYTTLGSIGKGRTSCGLANLNSNNVVEFTCQNTDAVLDEFDTLEWGVSLDTGETQLTCDEYSVVISRGYHPVAIFLEILVCLGFN